MAGKPKKKSNAGRPKFKATKKQLNAVYELARHGSKTFFLALSICFYYIPAEDLPRIKLKV